jgi:hypothetical protein
MCYYYYRDSVTGPWRKQINSACGRGTDSIPRHTEKQLYLAHDECINQLKWWPKPAEVRARIPAVEEKDNSNFVIEAGHRCGSCGETERLCIDEPRGSGSWRCRPCYTGMSDLEIKGRFGELADRMEHNPA